MFSFATSPAARGETGLCKPDRNNGLVCGDGPGAARVIDGTASPSRHFAFAWRSTSSAPLDLATDEEHYDLKNALIRLSDGAVLWETQGKFWNTGGPHVNRYEQTAAWSPDSRFVVEILDYRWQTLELRLFTIGANDKILVLDLKTAIEPAVRKALARVVKDEGAFDFAIFGSNDSETPHLAIDRQGLIKARIQMEIAKPETTTVLFDVTLRATVRNGTLSAREVSVHRLRE